MSPSDPRKVAIITGASQGIGEGLVAGFRRCGYAVVGTSLSIPAYDKPDYLTVQGDIAQADTALTVVGQALERFGRIDSLINDAGPTERAARRRRAAIADFPLAARPANATIFTASGPVGVAET